MKKLDLEKLHYICNKLSNKEQEFSERYIYVSLMGHNSNYSEMEFESFIKYYNFGFEDDNIVVFNDDKVSYENYTNQDFSYIPIILLSFDETMLEKYIENEINEQLKHQEQERLQRKEDLKTKIKLLQKELYQYEKL